MEKKIAFMIPLTSSGLSITEIARMSHLPENRLIHFLRQLTAINIFREPTPRMFAHTTTSAILRTPEFSATADLLLFYTDQAMKCAVYLPEALDLYANQSDMVQKPQLRTAFNLAFHTDAHFFDYITAPENMPRYGERFNNAMVGGGAPELMGPILALYDWSSVNSGGQNH